ncbi:MAG: 16S rRNA (cytosine(1402)-N(4))-methyltransferase RsmH [Sulfurospirillum sp.]|nr:16S rRNA (cytosine(1402)-N(4))-methyltransferase RsmH [Sulfurospirillum sp.]
MHIPHIPVLKDEVLSVFADIKTGYIIDCTLGYGGHSEALLQHNLHVKLICCDQDAEAIAFSKKRLEAYGDRVIFEHAKFSSIIALYKDYDIRGVLADIGVSSLQLDHNSRGFGFESAVLDMRMNPQNPLNASEVVNTYSITQLEEILREYGEMRNAKEVARAIVANRPFESAKELADIMQSFNSKPKIHPATLLFQAIRIEVNDELGELDELLRSIEVAKLKNTLIAIISFHSLEDRIVKRTFQAWSKNCICPPSLMRCICGNDHAIGKIISKKPIIPSVKEQKKNPRSRSAKMRVFRTFK